MPNTPAQDTAVAGVGSSFAAPAPSGLTPEQQAAYSGVQKAFSPTEPTKPTPAPMGPEKVNGVIQGNAPARSKMSSNGNFFDDTGNQYTKGPTSSVGTLTANVNEPSSTTSPAPVSISSTTASDHLASTKDNLAALNKNAADHSAAMATATPTTESSITSTTDTSSSTASDDAITKILAGLDQSLADTKATEDSQMTDIQKAQVDTQVAADQAAHDSYAKLDSIQNGTYPLSDAEHQLLDSTMQSYQLALQAQEGANAGALGRMTELMATLGIQATAPGQAIGMIHNIISEGAYKLSVIASKMSTAVANLQMKMQTQDFNQVQKASADLAKAFTDRMNALSKMQTSVTNASKNAQTQATNYAKTAITAIINTDKVNETAKNNAATQLYHSGLLSAREYSNLTARIKAQNSLGTVKPPSDAVISTETWLNNTRGADKYVDPNAYQQAFDAWTNSNYQAKDFIKNYPPKDFINPSNTWLPAYLKSKTSSATTSFG